MDINAQRSEIIRELSQINDASLLRAIKNLINQSLTVAGGTSNEQFKSELDEESFSLTESHREILDERLADHQLNREAGATWTMVKARIKR